MVAQTIVDGLRIPAGLRESVGPELGQMLGNRRDRDIQYLRQVTNAELLELVQEAE